ncbi:MAG: Rrf2 family transcriptional regulator [Bdellovibrionota bacterium]
MAAANTQFSIAIHLLASLGYRKDSDMCSGTLASSVNANPSFVRRVLAKLSKAGLVRTTTGKGGSCTLAHKPADISLLDIYKAVEAPQAFAIHNYEAEKACKVSCGIKPALENALGKAQKGLEESLKNVTLAEVISDLKQNSS